MTSTTMTTTRPLPTDKILVGIVFVLALAIIAGAWGSQLIGGLVPCELCLAQRQAYYWGLPVLALILILWNRLPLAVWYIAMLVAAGRDNEPHAIAHMLGRELPALTRRTRPQDR
jgi:disulfide bond formation protein DsbB